MGRIDARSEAPVVVAQSRLAQELSTLPSRVRQSLGLTDALVVVIAIVVAGCRKLTDDTDSRPLMERLHDLEAEIEAAAPAFEGIQVDLAGVTARFETLAKRFTGSPGFLRYFARLVGSAQYERLRQAALEDGAVVLVAVRRGMRALMPFALAVDDAVTFATPEQLAKSVENMALTPSVFALVVNIDELFDKLVDFGVPVSEVTSRVDESQPLIDVVTDLDALADRIHTVLEGRSAEVLDELSARLQRKMQGARDAIEYSADGVSQAANSLIEFIDWIFRTAFAEVEVLEWVGADAKADLKFNDHVTGSTRPTKFAQALCFTYGGRARKGDDATGQMVARGIVATRTALQQLKHADSGSEEERADIVRAIRAIEGYIFYSVRVGWVALDDDELLQLRVRLGDVRSEPSANSEAPSNDGSN